jgi:hypothetical protein
MDWIPFKWNTRTDTATSSCVSEPLKVAFSRRAARSIGPLQCARRSTSVCLSLIVPPDNLALTAIIDYEVTQKQHKSTICTNISSFWCVKWVPLSPVEKVAADSRHGAADQVGGYTGPRTWTDPLERSKQGKLREHWYCTSTTWSNRRWVSGFSVVPLSPLIRDCASQDMNKKKRELKERGGWGYEEGFYFIYLRICSLFNDCQ